MEKEELSNGLFGGLRPRVYESDTGRLEAHYAGNGVQFERLVGELDTKLGNAYLESMEYAMARCERVFIVSDWSNVTGYSSRVRQELTGWAINRRSTFDEVHIFTQKQIVAMGLSVASVFVTFLNVCKSTACFETAIRRAKDRIGAGR